MRVYNKTNYLTEDLKRIILKTVYYSDESYYKNWGSLAIKIIYRRGRDYPNGCAVVNGYYILIRLPKPPVKINKAELVNVIQHELCHVQGLRHNQMRKCWPTPPAPWVEDDLEFPLRLKI